MPGEPTALTVIDQRQVLRKALDAERAAGHTIGLVPTMGSLHGGHTSLIGRAASECDAVAVTLYVNPLQFGPTEDLARYPRDPAGDAAAAEAAGADYLFAPRNEEMFPEPPLTAVTVAGISDVLEGARRPGHFAGVATVVTKLLSLAGPCRAYFGEKDYQQLVVIRRLVADLSLPAEVIGCPTVRQADGLALSSRNAYLDPAERAAAPTLFRALQAGRAAVETDRVTDAAIVRAVMADVVAKEPRCRLDYADVADPATLAPLTTIAGPARLLIAARLGRTRLIDNLSVTASPVPPPEP